jgi:hypothetical protein
VAVLQIRDVSSQLELESSRLDVERAARQHAEHSLQAQLSASTALRQHWPPHATCKVQPSGKMQHQMQHANGERSASQ